MASFFSTVFGGGAEKDAAAKNKAALGQYSLGSLGALDAGLKRSEDALRTGRNSADWYLGRNYDLYDDMRTAGTGILDRGRNDSLTALEGARAAYDPVAALGTKYGSATDLALGALGARGAEGTAAARAAFQAAPGYEFARDQGLEAINRRRAASGMLGSGNADIDAIKFATGLADQTYGDWLTRLQSFMPGELSATSGAATGRAGIGRDMASLLDADTRARLGLEGAVISGQTGANTARGANDVALGNTLAGLYTGDATNKVGVYGNQLAGNTAANNQIAAGQISGAKNALSAGMGLASLAAGAFGAGGMFGAGGAFGGAAGAGPAGAGMFNNMQKFGFQPVSFAGL